MLATSIINFDFRINLTEILKIFFKKLIKFAILIISVRIVFSGMFKITLSLFKIENI
jgi:hypothetical protein